MYYDEDMVYDSTQTENISIEKPTTTFQSDDSRRREIEQLAQTNPLIRGLINGKLRFYIEPTPYYASPTISSVVSEISSSLESASIEELRFQRVYNENEADLHISWIKDYGPHTLGEAIFRSVVKVGLGATTCYNEWQSFDADTVKKIMWHEIGHSLGYGHNNNPNNVMYFQTDQRFEKDFDGVLTLDEGRGKTIPFCKGGTYSFSAISNDQSNGFLISVLAPGTSGQSFLDGQGKYYPSCSGAEKYYSLSNTCTIDNGASLMIHNEDELLQTSAIDVAVTIVDLNERSWPDMVWDESVFEYDQADLDEVWDLYH